MAIGDWSAAILCLDKDLVEWESQVLAWARSEGSCKKWRDKAKEVIEQKLRHALRQVELDTDEDDVLDLIADVTPLNHSACFMTLHLLANDKSIGSGDQWSVKSEMYYRKFQDNWPQALGLISIDVDESGTLEDGEKYNVGGVTFVRGS